MSNLMQAGGKLPNFFLVGAPKAGTTSLYHYLDQHPEVYMSPLKEPFYFCEEMRAELFADAIQPQARQMVKEMRRYLDRGAREKRPTGIVSEWEDYCTLFTRAGERKAVGEASVMYLWSKTAPVRIAERFPQAKILMILRNPVERAFSQYLHELSADTVRWSFAEHLQEALKHNEGEKISMFNPFLALGMYSAQVRRYRERFPKEQMRIWLYEETARPGFLREVWDFLGVNPEFAADTSQRHMEPRIPRRGNVRTGLRRSGVWRMMRHALPMKLRLALRRAAYHERGALTMEQPEREMLVEYYREDVGRLEQELGRDLSAWLR